MDLPSNRLAQPRCNDRHLCRRRFSAYISTPENRLLRCSARQRRLSALISARKSEWGTVAIAAATSLNKDFYSSVLYSEKCINKYMQLLYVKNVSRLHKLYLIIIVIASVACRWFLIILTRRILYRTWLYILLE